MKSRKYWNATSIAFNILETLLLVGMAWLLKLGVINTLLIFLTFEVSRAHFKMPKHYKAWQQCLIWTLLIFTSLFVVARVDITVGILATIFSAYILSGKADIENMYMWKNVKDSKYKALDNYVKYKRLCDDRRLINIEKQLEDDNPELYVFYKRRFIEHKTFKQMSEEFELENPRIVEKLDQVYMIMKYALKL